MSLGILLVAFTVTAPAVAQSRDAAAAELLFREGRKAMDAGDFESACPKLEESQRLDPGAGTLVNLAFCYEKLGKIATAWDRWSQALRSMRSNDERRPVVEKRMQEAEARLPKLVIELEEDAPEDTKIVRDRVDIGRPALGLALPVDPGTRIVIVSAPGHESRTFEVEAKEGEVSELVVAPGPPLPPGEEAPSPEEAMPPDDVDVAPPPEKKSPVLGLVIGGVGVAGLVVGGVTGGLALGKKNDMQSDCERDGEGVLRCGSKGLAAADKGNTLAAVSTAGFAVGAVGIGLGLFLILRNGGDEAPVTAIAPSVLPGGGGAVVTRSF